MRAADQTYERPASTGLLTELGLPVYLAAWTMASLENDRLRPRDVRRNQTDSDEDGDEALLERPIAEGRGPSATTAILTLTTNPPPRGQHTELRKGGSMSSFDRVVQAQPNGSAASSLHAPRGAHVDLVTVSEAAAMLRVSDATIRNWIAAESIPYIQLPPVGQRKQYRIPLQGLLASLQGNYDLRGALQEQNARMREADLPED